MSRVTTHESRNESKRMRFASKSPDEANADQKDKNGKKDRKGGAVLGEINDDPKKKKSG